MRTVGCIGMKYTSESTRVHFVCRGTLQAFALFVAEMEQRLTETHSGITSRIEEQLMKEATGEVDNEETLDSPKVDGIDEADSVEIVDATALDEDMDKVNAWARAVENGEEFNDDLSVEAVDEKKVDTKVKVRP